MSKEPVTQFYEHGRFKVAGGVLPNAITAYRTYGDKKILASSFRHATVDGLTSYMIGPDKALNPEKYYIVTFALFSNGESSSPSNTRPPYDGPYFPEVSYEDNIRAQHVVLTKNWVYRRFSASWASPWAYYWPVMFPDIVERTVVLCGSARTSPHNQCFIEGPMSALLASKDFENGHYKTTPQHGIRAFGRVYSAWAYGQTWYRKHKYLYDGKYANLNSFLREEWEAGFLDSWDANDMLTLINTWQKGDVSLVRHSGDFERCLGEIKAKALIMPCKNDLYFPPEDNEIEVSLMKNTHAEVVVIDSDWGHMAGGGANPEDDAFIKAAIDKFFTENA
ncbi:alpha/beta hydrolase fold protein [Multifurca ochricompacta]|uniref:Alpha/beta hydrolase fold protein n=1 Tax=Multifurca ochricompacta TaxID=376703 RepID=A0AAD4M8L2_9AGAM|nr:alpha/beta hydrolase fold protein [Multifurca ochricompacta]